jgi:hypothetical protein
MYFIIKFPTIAKQHDFVMVVVDKSSKETHFIHVKFIHKIDDIARIFMR